MKKLLLLYILFFPLLGNTAQERLIIDFSPPPPPTYIREAINGPLQPIGINYSGHRPMLAAKPGRYDNVNNYQYNEWSQIYTDVVRITPSYSTKWAPDPARADGMRDGLLPGEIEVVVPSGPLGQTPPYCAKIYNCYRMNLGGKIYYIPEKTHRPGSLPPSEEVLRLPHTEVYWFHYYFDPKTGEVTTNDPEENEFSIAKPVDYFTPAKMAKLTGAAVGFMAGHFLFSLLKKPVDSALTKIVSWFISQKKQQQLFIKWKGRLTRGFHLTFNTLCGVGGYFAGKKYAQYHVLA